MLPTGITGIACSDVSEPMDRLTAKAMANVLRDLADEIERTPGNHTVDGRMSQQWSEPDDQGGRLRTERTFHLKVITRFPRYAHG